MRYSGVLVASLVVALVPAVGCKKSKQAPTPADTTDYSKEVAALEAKLKFVEGLKAALPPPTRSDAVTADPKLTFAKWWVHDTDLANVEATPPPGLRVKDAKDIRECAKEARHPDFGKHSFDRLGTCNRTRYVLVVRTLARVDPKVTSEAKGMESGKFSKGTANGDVLVFDLDAKKPVGGYRWAVESSASVSDGKIQTDLEKKIHEAIEEGSRKYMK